MKRIIILCFICIMLFACVPTPTEEVVLNKTEGRLEAAITETTPVPEYVTEQISVQPDGTEPETPQGSDPHPTDEPRGTLRTALSAPEHCTDGAEGKVFGGTLKVEIDADVEIPNVSKVPVFTVREKAFTAAEKEQMTKTLLGDGPYYRLNQEKMRRDMEKANIDEQTAFLALLDAHAFGDSFPYDDYREGYEHNLNNDLKSYAQLPEPGPMVPWDGSFDSERVQLADETNRWIMIGDGKVYLYDSCTNAPMALNANRMPETGEERKAAEAAVTAFAKLSAMQFAVTAIEGDNEGFNMNFAGTASLPITQYDIMLTPVIAGIPAYPYRAYHGSDTGMQAAGFQNDYSERIYPMCAEALTENGEVISLSWENVYEIAGTENENVALLPFERILDAFKKQVYYSIYLDPPEKGESDGVMCMVVEHIRFSYMRVKRKDGNGEDYLLPVWDFMGYDYNPAHPHSDYDLHGTKSWFSHQSLLTVNAIDGSIIDRNAGY